MKRRSKKECYVKVNVIIWKSIALQKNNRNDQLKYKKTVNNGYNKRFYWSKNTSIGLKKGQLIWSNNCKTIYKRVFLLV